MLLSGSISELSDIKINIIGVGRVSSSIARNLVGKVKFGYVISRDKNKAENLAKEIGAEAKTYEDDFLLSGIVLFGVSDSALPDVCKLIEKKVDKNIVAIHFSGFLPSDILPESWSSVSMHPNCAVSNERYNFRDVIFGIEGVERGLQLAKNLVELLGGKYVVIPKERKAEYHLAAVIASNFSIALAYLSQRLYTDIGFSEELSRKVISKLFESVSQNIASKNLKDALTGPVKRGDWEVVEQEGKIFDEYFPEFTELYDIMVKVLKKLNEQ
ncbi:DUF2520 domain-containing protein [Fervidobacterium pennivorans subsp. shakshaketiis]|jgi:predicted short-subunit dehydrogenase-like oxidoreductase (DUF2520 family)|uniref:DUF2520 domain-containing protein n=1 Tax=Fervidobacterium pennivorans (strain DSM 9078 / Ven5) TaxID=771875 RepID=H9UDS9_FERPD|nr:DUF2520 domain-containing protein [Fervidobacterium pennivorans]AFG35672.1 hypothetical protein Ferpe_1613 [Fervidobacterium pennivorans DSM 9078]